jgi:four helix bundle protein
MINFKLQTSNFELRTSNGTGLRHLSCSTHAVIMPKELEPFHLRGFRFGCDIVRLYLKLVRLPDLPPFLARQALRAGTSIGANLEEGKGAQSRPDTKAKFSIALKEARETSYWLRLLSTTSLAPAQLLEPLIREANELIAILTVARRNLAEHEDG